MKPSVFVCFISYEKPLSFSFPLRVFLTQLEAEEWVKDHQTGVDAGETLRFVEIEIG